MNIKRVISIPTFACLAVVAVAQGTTTVSGTAGSVAGKESNGTWVGLAGSANTATIGYTSDGFPTGGSEYSGHEDKFSPGSSGPVGRIFDGANQELQGGEFHAQGQSSVSNGVTTYYTAGFTSQTTSYGGSGSSTDSGTYDPWDIHYQDVLNLGSAGTSVDLYYQSGLQATGAGGASTGFTGYGAGAFGSYTFSLYITAGATTTSLLDITIDSNGNRSYTIGTASNIQLFLLGGNAANPNATPGDRIAGRPLVTATNLDAFFTPRSGSDPGGSLVGDLNIGILYSGFVIPTTGNPDDVLFSWHTDLVGRSSTAPLAPAVPAPAAMVAFAACGLARLRRRRS